MVSAAIDASALRHNLKEVRRRAPNSRVMAVVKANAYGHGLITAARALDAADALAVARTEEGLALRRAGIGTRVLLLEGVLGREQLDAAAAAGLELVVHTAEQIALLRAAPAGQRFKVWLKLDSGMNRLGFKPVEFAAAYAALRTLPAVDGALNLLTHLASADEPQRTSTAEQLKVFDAVTRSLPGERSIGNSAGILACPDALTDWVRPGLMLYGVSPFEGTTGADYGLRPVMTLRSRLIAVKELGVGECVGYGGDWSASRPTRLGIGAVGYGDGYPRNLASGTPLLLNGQRVALAGRVSMDMIGVDVTDAGAAASLGDALVLWGEGLPVEEVARWAQTIPYTLLCGVGQRVAMHAA